MVGKWTEVKVEDIKAPSPNALATGPFGSSISSRFFQTHGIPVIRGSNLSEKVGIRLIAENTVFLSPEKAGEFSRSIVRRGDLIFTCWGTIGQVGLIDKRAPFSEYVISNKQMKLTPDPNKADSLFLYYLFSSPEISNYIKNQAIGSSVPGFNLSQLRSLKLLLPSLEEQCAIAHVLDSLDDKIELNRQMNKTLEAIARAVFKSWFIDFDPVHAKMEGREPYGMDAQTAALFPDGFEDSALGEIPKGWKAGSLENVATILMGQSPSGETYNEEGDGLPFYQGIRDFGFRFPSRRVYCTEPTRIAEKGTVFLSVRAPVGSLNVAIERCAIGRGIAGLTSKIKGSSYLYYLLKANYTGWQKFEADGTVFGAVSKNDVHTFAIIQPPHRLIERFNQLMEPFDAHIEANEEEISTLKTLRDTLLPKLISGQIRVKDAEKIAEALPSAPEYGRSREVTQERLFS